MAKFVYRMQNILDIKQKLEDQERINFAMANARVNEEQEELQELLVRRAGYDKQLKELTSGPIDVAKIRICKTSIDAMKSMIREQMLNLHKAQKDAELARKRLNEVMQERKMHEKLREKAFEQFKQELNKEESKAVDELVSYTYSPNVNN